MLAKVLAPSIGLVLFTKFVLKKIVPAIDQQPAWLQQFIILGEGYLFTLAGKAAGVTLPLDIHGWTADTVSSLVYGALALAAHAIWKTNTAAATRLPSSSGK